jgi:3',5'-cyclic AMP phosphodiesterase CpdA
MLAGGSAFKFAWPARGSEKGTLRFVFYTDVHARQEWETPTALKMAAQAINRHAPDLVIAGGDLITDGFQSVPSVVMPRWEAYMQLHRRISSDLYPTIGNHDLVGANPEDGSPPEKNPRAMFLAQTGLDRTYYSFDAVGYHFVVLDSIQITQDHFQYHGQIGPEQIEWLKKDLAQTPKGTPIVITTHMPLLTAFYAASAGGTFAAPKNRVVVNNIEILKLIADHNVILVLQGHLHVKEMIRWQNTTFITGGAVCGKWWRGAWYGAQEGFNVITLAGSQVGWDYIDYGWQARRPSKK